MKQVILASQSPRRKELMEKTGFPFSVEVSDVEETVKEGLKPYEVVMDLAVQKAEAVLKKHPDAVVLGSDTIVVVDNRILGKPHSMDEAREMMHLLRGRSHDVITGVAILYSDKKEVFYDLATVHFDNIDDEAVEEYIRTDEAYDKAGGYAIQGWAGRYIGRIEGNYYTIMGLPINRVYQKLKELES